MGASGDMRRIARGLTATALLVFAAVAALAAPAMGSAVVIRDTVTAPIFETGLPHDCRPGITGTATGTDVMSFQSVETSTGFRVHVTIVDSARIDWSDGTYTLIGSVDHFSFNAVGQGTTTFTNAHQDAGDFYSADGVFEFRDTFHEVEHLTVTNGVVRVDFSKGHFHFFGDC
jgi:hypothetical protein